MIVDNDWLTIRYHHAGKDNDKYDNDKYCTASSRPFLSKEASAAYATHRKRE